jgi:hypothetical protein
LVLLLHLALLLGLLRAVTTPIRSPTVKAREMILRLMPLRKSPLVQKTVTPTMTSPQARSPVVPLVPPPLTTAPNPDLSRLGRSLFGCAPENLSNLSREERAHCDTGLARPDTNAMTEPRSYVKDPGRRAAEIAAKNTPGHIPCTYIAAVPGPQGLAPVPTADPFCVMDGLINGFEPLNGLSK